MTDREPPSIADMRERIRQVHARRGRKLSPATEALADQMLATGSDIADQLIKMSLNMRALLEVSDAERAVEMAHDMVTWLQTFDKSALVGIIREMVIRISRDLTKDYETIADFRAALLAGKVEGYSAKTPEERDLDLLSMPPEGP
jgi:hypothetical protein